MIEDTESQVHSYCRSFPAVFSGAEGCRLIDDAGRSFLDFFSGAGALNYGHNHPILREALVAYLLRNGIIHALDMATEAKHTFISRFQDIILKPRELDYRIQFPGPTGTNAVEAALKLARKVTGRKTILSFINGFHGVTLGALAVTHNPYFRNGSGVPLPYAEAVPFDCGLGAKSESLLHLESKLQTAQSQSELPAALILETVQCEGGIHVADTEWLQGVASILKRYGVLLIIDDIQAGCGRTGTFFSFEAAGIKPDIVCLSKSLSGYGLPLSLNLIRPEHDLWKPGEHNGTFRSNNLALVTASSALSFWETPAFSQSIQQKSDFIFQLIQDLQQANPGLLTQVRGRGLVIGLDFGVADLGKRVAQEAFRRGLIIETAGHQNEVLKIMPPLIIEPSEIEAGFNIIEHSIKAVLAPHQKKHVHSTAVQAC